jgi:hypothetical protein
MARRTVGTNFSKRASSEYAHDASLTEYNKFVANANAIIGGFRAARPTTAEDVARVIYNATTDDSNQLRCLMVLTSIPW